MTDFKAKAELFKGKDHRRSGDAGPLEEKVREFMDGRPPDRVTWTIMVEGREKPYDAMEIEHDLWPKLRGVK
jgi:hypothetical protein